MRISTILASGAALCALAVPAYAETPESETPFRTVEAQEFSSEDLQRYGLTEAETARATIS